MASEDESGVDIGIGEKFGGLLRGFELESTPGRGGAGARDGADGLKAHALDRLQSRKNQARGKAAGTNTANSHLIAKTRPGNNDRVRRLSRFGGYAAVLQNRRVEPTLQIGVCLCALFDGVAMIEERGDIYLFGRQQVQEGFHVAPLGPAYVPDGVVEAAFLVLRIVSSGPIGAGKGERQLFHVHVAARNAHADSAHDDYATTIAENLCS